METRYKYFNPAQIDVFSIDANEMYVVGSRGIGKSEGMDAPRLVRCVFGMPGSMGGLLSPSYKKLKKNTLPAVCKALSEMGYHNNIHYVIGRKPPKHFRKPIVEPFDYDYVMTWFNGTIVHLLSFDGSMSANSMSLDWILGFEAKFLDKTKIDEEVIPAVRGFNADFENHPLFHSKFFTTDMPTYKSGMWILDKEKDMDSALISEIRVLYSDLSVATSFLQDAVANGNTSSANYYERNVKDITKHLNAKRQKAVYFGEYSALDNIEILGEDWFITQYRNLPNIIYRTSILNQRIRKVENGFYSALNEKLHTYVAPDKKFELDMLGYNYDSFPDDCRADGDIDPTKPICIALDYNSAISSVSVGQRVGSKIKTINWMFVKTPKKLEELMNEFADYYQPLVNRDIIYYFDHTAVVTSAVSDETFKDIVVKVLRKRGFNVTEKYIGQAPAHSLKHTIIDKALKGDPTLLFPSFNKHNCETLFAAMEQTRVKQGKSGFEKDKSDEKKPDTPDAPDELKTHGTDSWDTLFWGVQYFHIDSSSSVPSGFM